ncbi:Spy/CpxP family protein refolding chaperone [Thorsellia anophelis]|uniref:LTXXQ motif family protein n=1 Tax=Thorsellia anophelis DSM 18579 TaxID=1123402 RepID=A0A1I0BND4_9GAMM|nr:Spy/CpxP family protein refolding chaperone [Thorsellia anophelis]SET08472.1 LTXXQ motif family protein [Thorsellia anophelis DSM 18579]
MNRLVKFALIPTILTTLTFSVLAETDNMGVDRQIHKHQVKIDRMFAGLNLTEEQKQAISALIQERATQQNQQLDTRKAIESLALSNNFDEAKAKELIQAQAEQRQTRQLEKLKLKNEIYNLLTPEQKTQFTASLEQRESKRSQLKDERREGRKDQRRNDKERRHNENS